MQFPVTGGVVTIETLSPETQRRQRLHEIAGNLMDNLALKLAEIQLQLEEAFKTEDDVWVEATALIEIFSEVGPFTSTVDDDDDGTPGRVFHKTASHAS